MKRVFQIWAIGVVLVGTVIGFESACADNYTSTTYKINGTVGADFGGYSNSAMYKLVDAGGENAIGNGASGSYKMGMGYVSQLDRSLRLTMQPSGLTAYYPFEEATGAYAYDNSANSHSGALQATPTWTTGKVGGALTFNGSSQYVSLADFDIAGSAITVEAWVYPTLAGQTGKVVGKQTGTTDAQGTLGLVSGNAAFETTTGGVYHTVSALSALTINSWSHVVGVYDGASVSLYVNGALANSTPANGTLANNNVGWAIGRLSASGSSNYFTGSIDEVKIYSRALVSAEVKSEYDAGVAGNVSGVSLGAIAPGVSNTALTDVIVQTDASGYALLINQNHDLQNSTSTIPAISTGTVSAPVAWVEGSTKGLGFTLYATNATAIPGGWASGANYAAFPGTATTFYTRTGVPSGKDYLTLKVRADTSTATPAYGTPYTNTVTLTGVATP